MTETSGDGSGPKILNFPIGEKFFSSPTTRFRALHFYGPMIEIDGTYITPIMVHHFETPANEEQVRKVINDVIKYGGCMGNTGGYYIFIPWPCAAIYLEKENQHD